MSHEDNADYKGEESDEIVLSLLRLLMKEASHAQFERNRQSHHVDKASEELEPVSFVGLSHEDQVGDGPDHIEQEGARHVVVSDRLNIFVGPGLLYEVKNDLE